MQLKHTKHSTWFNFNCAVKLPVTELKSCKTGLWYIGAEQFLSYVE